MTVTQYYNYIESLAENHVSIAHASSSKHFFRGELEEFYMDLRNKVKFPALIAESFELSFDNENKTRETSFIIAKDYRESKNWDNIYAAMEQCETIGDEVLRRMISDSADGEICANVTPISATPLLDEQHLYVGIRYTIRVEDAFDYNSTNDKWNDL